MYIIHKTRNLSHIYNDESITEKDRAAIEGKKYDKIDTLQEAMSFLNERNKQDIADNILNKSIQDIIEEIIPSIEEQTKRLVVDYIQNNQKLDIVTKTSSDQKKDFKIAYETKTYMVAERGEFKPLEYSNVFEFLQEPTKNPIGSRQKTIGETIGEKITIDSDIVSTVCQKKSKVKASERPFIEFFINSEYFKEYSDSYIKETIIRFVYGDISAYFMKNEFYGFYKKACELCGVSLKNIEYLTDCNEYFKSVIFDAIWPRLSDKRKTKGKKNIPKKENLEKLNRKNNNAFKKLQNAAVPCSNKGITKNLDNVRKYLENAINYQKACEKTGQKIENIIQDMVMEIARLESMRYEYEEITVNISDIVSSVNCARDLLWNGLDYVMRYTYINEATKSRIIELIPASPELEYPDARDMERHFILHYGPTNSGKTYQAIEALKHAESGVYLGPLRLLALEIQDNLIDDGVPCSLLTGEEENLIEGARHMASTVEKLDPTEKYDVCVIDEAQMIDDAERGFAWTRAILGVQAKEIHVCMAPEARTIVKKLINLCDDTYEEVEHKRRSELVVEDKVTRLEKNYIQEGDAYIVFSKKKVLQVAAELVKKGVKVSMIYGNLPYPVRKKQVKRFINGDTQVVVSTNAIGMGINLPVRRIIFLEDRKFNGTEVAPLTITDIKQIAGRAGRNKETGYVASILYNSKEIRNTLKEDTPEIADAYLGFSDVIISIDAPLNDILRVWRSIGTPDMFKRMDIDRYIYLDEAIYVDVTKKQKLKMISIPFDERNKNLFAQWKSYCQAFENGNNVLEPPTCKGDALQALEEYCQALDLWYSFSKNFGYPIDLEWLRNEKAETSEKINNILVKNADMFQKKCECCGKPMHWANPYKMCDKCYNEMRYMRYDSYGRYGW